MHAATFGGNPIAAAAGIATIEMIERENLLTNAKTLADLFRTRFNQLAKEVEIIQDVRVIGMMIGIDLSVDGTPYVSECMKRGLLINCTQGHVIRLLPAMNLTLDEANEGIDIIFDVLKR
jgi:acetylornithine/succinyldiaminopimelate/putrescine aminotransferase